MSKMFGGAPKAAPVTIPKPKLPAPVRMPTPTDPAMEDAAQRSRVIAMKRKGRMSTILTDQMSGNAGGSMGSSGTKLGA